MTRQYHRLDGVLTKATPLATVTYTYDGIGRRATMAVPGQATTSYAYDNANRLTTITQGSNVVTFDYDHADRRTKRGRPGWRRGDSRPARRRTPGGSGPGR